MYVVCVKYEDPMCIYRDVGAAEGTFDRAGLNKISDATGNVIDLVVELLLIIS